MINVEELLKPIADGKPCGEDFSYHPSYQNLERLARGDYKPVKPTSGRQEEPEWVPPDWKEVEDGALVILRQSKHLGAGLILTLALLKIHGLEGFNQGTALLRGFLEKFWPDLYPKLDVDDKNDPTERLNILNNLSSASNPYPFIVNLRQISLCNSPTLGRVTLQHVLTARDRAAKRDSASDSAAAKPETGVNEIQAAFREAGPDSAKTTLALVNDAIANVKALENFLDSMLGGGRGVDFKKLNQMLLEMKQAVEPFAPIEASVSDRATAEGAAPTMAAPKPQSGIGIIQTASDVLTALDKICDYYRVNEPSSPVPLILRRAQKLVDKDFMSITADLSPDALPKLQAIFGTKQEK